jgi:acyl-CoA thioester hydrolase
MLDAKMQATPPEGFRVARWIEIRFSDTDMVGHVNNVAYVAFLETLRFHYLAHLDFTDILTLAAVRADFRVPARYGDRLVGATRATRVGRSSFDLQHVLLRPADGRVVADGLSTLVAIDARAGASTPLTPGLRQALATLDGPAGATPPPGETSRAR